MTSSSIQSYNLSTPNRRFLQYLQYWNLIQTVSRDTLYPEQIKQSRIVLGYLWPNQYYQVDKEEIICVPSRVSLATGVTTSEVSTYADSPSPPSPQAELPIPPNHFTSGLWVPSEASTSQLKSWNYNQPPITAELTPDEVLAWVRSGVNLDEFIFSEGNITFWQLQNINRNANPYLYSELSHAADNNYKPPHHEASEGEGEDKKSSPLPIPDPLGTHLRIPESEQLSEEQSQITDWRDTLEQ